MTDRLAALECRRTALPNRARSVVGEHPGGLNETGTDAGSVLSAELAGSAPPQADGIVRWERMSAGAAESGALLSNLDTLPPLWDVSDPAARYG